MRGVNFVLSTIALLAGPFIYALGRRNTTVEHLLDAVVILTVAWIITFHIVPEVVAIGGILALAMIAAGMAFPFVLRRIFHLASNTTHFALLVLAAVALALQAIIDGIALLPATGNSLSLAVILHRLPIGMAIWWTFRPALGHKAAVVAFAIIIVATGSAYFLGGPVIDVFENRTLVLFQAFVSGSLIDLVIVGIRKKMSQRTGPDH